MAPRGSSASGTRPNSLARHGRARSTTSWLKRYLDGLIANPPKVATRKASELALEAINAAIPATIGGSADLTGSNNTKTKGQKPLTADDYAGRYIYYGIREFGMAAAMNGMALHGGVIPYGGTFLIFSDYCRPAIRLSALQKVRVIYVMTHDSIGLGEDGPTHQPIEHLPSLRAMPELDVYRPADAVETAECWALALASRGPVAARADAPESAAGADRARRPKISARAAPTGSGPPAAPRKVVLIATGSEVEIALAVADALEAQGIGADVVSMPCWSCSTPRTRPIARISCPTCQREILRVSIEAGDDLRLGALHRPARPAHRPRPVRRFGAGRATCSSISAYRRRDRAARRRSYWKQRRYAMTQSCNQRFRPHRPAGRPRDARAAG